MFHPLIFALALGAALVAEAPAYAQPADVVHVDLGDLNLATVTGRTTLHQRVEEAITAVCGRFDGGDSLHSGTVDACRDSTRSTIGAVERKVIATARQRAMIASAEPDTRVR